MKAITHRITPRSKLPQVGTIVSVWDADKQKEIPGYVSRVDRSGTFTLSDTPDNGLTAVDQAGGAIVGGKAVETHPRNPRVYPSCTPFKLVDQYKPTQDWENEDDVRVA